MKRFTKSMLTIILLTGFTHVVTAQTVPSGAWMLGGSMGFNSIKTDGDDNTETYFNISPNVGYYVINNLAIGARFNFLNYSYDGESESQFGFGPWARLYVVNSLFAQVGVDFGSTGMDFFSLLADEGSTTLNFGLGYSFFISNAVAIEPQLQYSIYNGDEDGFFVDYSKFGFNIGVQAFLGRNE